MKGFFDFANNKFFKKIFIALKIYFMRMQLI